MRRDEPQRFSERTGAAGRLRSAFGVALGLLLGAVLGVPGCLNPRPEEDPSAERGPATVDENDAPAGAPQLPSSPERESCEENALLAGCEPASDLDPPEASPAPAFGSEPTDAGAPGASDAGSADAGAASEAATLAD